MYAVGCHQLRFRRHSDDRSRARDRRCHDRELGRTERCLLIYDQHGSGLRVCGPGREGLWRLPPYRKSAERCLAPFHLKLDRLGSGSTRQEGCQSNGCGRNRTTTHSSLLGRAMGAGRRSLYLIQTGSTDQPPWRLSSARMSQVFGQVTPAAQDPCKPKAIRQTRSAPGRIVVQASLPALKALPSPEARERSQDGCTTRRDTLGDAVRAGSDALWSENTRLDGLGRAPLEMERPVAEATRPPATSRETRRLQRRRRLRPR